jgi:3',5'-cyclic AMP phosphodiesterase CpdA
LKKRSDFKNFGLLWSATMLIAQLSDLHISCIDPARQAAQHLRAVIRQLNHTKPDLVILTGDLVADEGLEDYLHLKTILADLHAPYLLLPGNHDDPHTMAHVFPDAAPPDFSSDFPFWQWRIAINSHNQHINTSPDNTDLLLIGLDTKRTGANTGTICAQRMQWLTQQLSNLPHTPPHVFIFMHHLPFATGIPKFEKVPFQNASFLEALITPSPASPMPVLGIAAGHLHTAIHGCINGVPYSICPSIANGFSLKVNDKYPLKALSKQPAYLLHGFMANNRHPNSLSWHSYMQTCPVPS